MQEGAPGYGAPGDEIGHLPQGVHPGIGAPGAGETDCFPGDAGQGRFNDCLDGQGVFLALPPVVARCRRIPG